MAISFSGRTGAAKLLLIAAASWPSMALAQTAAQQDPAEATLPSSDGSANQDDTGEIVVTGTSIRGAPPVGGNLVSVGREEIESTGAINTQQILKAVPAITGMGSPGVGQNAGNSYYAPTIHSLGSSASNSTLVLIDGHRIPLGHTSLALPDPSIVPPIALERVEVLAEGASATYGSDAVAGVVNFITRKRYEGVQATAQFGFGSSYRTRAAGLLGGTTWEGGSAMVAFGYSHNDAVPYDYANRPYLQPNHIDEGGTNFQSFNCSPATIQPQGVSGIYLSPTATSTVANTTANAPCDNQPYGDRIGDETRYNVMVKVSQEMAPGLTLSGDIIYSDRRTITQQARGGIQATVFRTGAQANPFYVNPPGVVAGTTAGDRQTIRWQADDLLGPGAFNDNGAQTWIATANLEWRINDNFRLTAMALAGEDRTASVTEGALCTSCATLALNGTTTTGGSTTQPVPGTTLIPLNLPLTAANALDVWNPASSNRTSAAVRAMLTDSRTSISHVSQLRQYRIGIDGALFDLPAGSVRIAIGAEAQQWVLNTTVVRPLNSGPASLGSTQRYFPLDRHVESAYGEILIPVISPEMGTFLHKVDLNFQGRFDNYSDFGDTFNPKVAANVEVVEGLKFRANWSRSFVAPSMRSVGDPLYGTYSNSTASSTSTTAQVSIARFPDVANIPGISCSGGFCTIGNNIQGLVVDTGNPNVGPQRGTTWSYGVDFAPRFLPGFRASVTLFNNQLRGGITSPCAPSCILNNGALNYLLTIYPTGASQAQIAAQVNDVPITTAFPTTVYYIFRRPQSNALDLDVQGLDISVGYQFTTGIGTFQIGGSLTELIKFDQGFVGGAKFDILNSVGINSTFPSIARQGRANIGWKNDGGFSLEFYMNHVGSYKNWGSGTINPLVLDANGNVSGGGDIVKAWTTFDLHFGWNFSKGGALGDTEVYFDVNNVFNKYPPFFNNANGYDPFGSNPLGRVVNVGLRAKW
ncbi:TonB-dependent receptor [Sphingomonas sp. AOB5]|uniref:TonB-dependent receptor domain-containing protein n=1 Tax=Sphingomonas sp. AOB5 TaxID=3034017 RepID=UPI0023F84775|nr:TonB-dependent receptor [Sphingomonas sp. AOB5]MDF7776300.1 TonB-dependent receptor [Sphingomonas sp. AOB5]